MSDFGVTDKGFVIKRMDRILEEIHTDLTAGFGVDTRLQKPSFLDILVTTFAYQIAEVWETAQNSYYAKYPATATGINLDNAVQYGGIRREAARKTVYPLHCTGADGTVVPEDTLVATNSMPEVRLRAAEEFVITRESFHTVEIAVSVVEVGDYFVSINGAKYCYESINMEEGDILEGIAASLRGNEYDVDIAGRVVKIKDRIKNRNNALVLSDNLTTRSVTTIANFLTEDYGKITLPNGIISKIINNTPGFMSVENVLSPSYGRKMETDIELRQSYLAKSALRSNSMVESIIAELLNNVNGVESATGYENPTNSTDARGLPPHSIEIIVDGGDTAEIANAILRRKAGGIHTFGSVEVQIPGGFGEMIPIRFNRPEYRYAWLKIVIHGDRVKVPEDFGRLVAQSVLEDCRELLAGNSLLIQLLNEGIYAAVPGTTLVEILTAVTETPESSPQSGQYLARNIVVTPRQRIMVEESRIEVVFNADE